MQNSTTHPSMMTVRFMGRRSGSNTAYGMEEIPARRTVQTSEKMAFRKKSLQTKVPAHKWIFRKEQPSEKGPCCFRNPRQEFLSSTLLYDARHRLL